MLGFESPGTAQGADRPIDTHDVNAMERTGSDANIYRSGVWLRGGTLSGGTVDPNARAPEKGLAPERPITQADVGF